MLQVGTVGLWIVGAPGPEYDVGVVAGYSHDGKYIVRHKIWGEGNTWYESLTRELLPYDGDTSDAYYTECVELGKQLVAELLEQQ